MYKCFCCGSEIVDECGYCKFIFAEVLDKQALIEEEEDAAQHRITKITSLKNFRTQGYAYDFNGNNMKETQPPHFKLGDGAAAYGKILWSQEQFAQCHDKPKQLLTIQYDTDTVTQSVSCEIDMPKTKDFWRLGVEIDDTLHLTVYLGEPSNCTKATSLPLKFV